MGALRAAELDRYGMEGIGHVYEEYRSGQIVGDDEVALLHGPAEAGYPPFSQPLVNIRATLAAAQEKALVEEDERRRLIDLLAAMPYQRRTYRVLAELAAELGMSPSRAGAVDAFCRENTVDVKRSDALLLLDRLTGTTEEPAPRPRLSRTWLLHNWELEADGERSGHGGVRVSDAAALRACQLFARDYPEFYRDLVFDLVGRECAAECPAYRDDLPAARAAVEHGSHRGFYPDRLGEREFGFLTQWTTESERTERSPQEVLPTFVVRAFRIKPGGVPMTAMVDLLKGTRAFDRGADVVRAAAQLEREVQAAGRDSSDLPAGRVIEWFAKRWGVDPENLELAALDRGLDSLEAFLDAARPYYLLAKYNHAVVDFSVRTDHTATARSPGSGE